MRKILRLSNLGFTIVETMVALGISGALMGSVAAYIKLTADTKRKVDLTLALSDIKENIIQNINSPNAWNMSINNSSSLSCIKYGSSGCTGTETGPIAVYNGAGNLLVGTSPNSGFDREGKLCNSFDGIIGDENCIFHYSVSWAAMCSYSPCYDPQVRITATLIYSPRDPKLKNNIPAGKFSFTFYRAETIPNSLEAVCTSLGGTYNAGTNSCQLPWANFTCPAGTVMRGLNASNIPSCYYPNYMTCNGNILRAVDSAGAPGCVVKTCSGWKTPIGWSEGPPGSTFDDWMSAGGDGADGGCDGTDGACDGGAGGS